jgi:hypothetical protein
MSESPVKTAVGWMLLVLGGLWLLLTGGCSLVYLGSILSNSDMNDLPSTLVICAVAVAPGVALLWGGTALLRAGRKAAASEAPKAFD